MIDKRALAKRIEGMSIDEAARYFITNYPVMQIAEALADLLLTEHKVVKPITISKEEFEEHFRVKGFTAEGASEKRGRPLGSKNKPKPEDATLL